MKKAHLVWIVSSLFLASVEPVIAKFAYASGVTPLALFFVKSTVGILFGIFGIQSFRKLRGIEIASIGFLGLLLSTTSLLTLFALTRVSAVLAVTVVSVTPAMVALVNSYLGRDILSKQFWFGFAFCFTGVLLSIDATKSFSNAEIDTLGAACLFGAVISSTMYRSLLERVTKDVPSPTVSSLMFFINGILSLVIFGPWILPEVNQTTLAYGTWIGFAAILANIAFVKCIAILGSTRSSIINMLQRPLVVLVAAIWLDEPMNVFQWTGVVLVFFGIHLARKVVRRSSVGAKNPPEMR